jgi:hypothetical protein
VRGGNKTVVGSPGHVQHVERWQLPFIEIGPIITIVDYPLITFCEETYMEKCILQNCSHPHTYAELKLKQLLKDSTTIQSQKGGLNKVRVPPPPQRKTYNWNLTRSVPLCDITQHRVIILYRRFGTTYRSHLQGSRSLEDGTDMLSRNVGK